MDQNDANRERHGSDVPRDVGTAAADEKQWRETAETRPEQMTHPEREIGGFSEGTKEGHARSLRRSHRSGRVADELGGARGRTK